MIKKRYKHVVIAVDVVIFTIIEEQLHVLLIKMKRKPYLKAWAAPGGLVDVKDSVEQAAQKHLHLKAGVKDIYLEQLYTFGEASRDPFGRVVTVAYFALIPSRSVKLKTTKEYGGVKWFPVGKLPQLAYDHRQIIEYAVHRLKLKLERSNVVYGLLPREFTLAELKETYEIILGKKIDKRNFYKKVKTLKIIRATGRLRRGEANRPAMLYTFITRQPKQISVL
ncbi:MAG: NUDIX domain-containing protein [Patescibacteria group bacterium]